MKKTPKYVLLALALSLGGTTMAQTQQEPSGDGIWTLEEAVNYARQNNLQVQQSRITRDLNEADLKQSKFQRLPSISANGSYSFNSGSYQSPIDYSRVTSSSQTSGFSGNASLPLFMGFQQTNIIKQNQLELQASEQDVLSAQNDVIIQLVTSYLNILFADELIKTTAQQRDLTNQQLERNRILYNAGSIAENAVLELESQLASDELALINAQNQRDIARLSLMQLLDLPTSQDFQIEVPEIPEPDQSPILVDGDHVYEIALQTLPAIKAADLRVLSAAKALDIARGAYYPRISLNAGISTNYSSIDRYLLSRETIDNGLQPQQIGFYDAEGTEPIIVYVPDVSVNPVYGDYSFLNQLQDNIYKQASLGFSIPILNGLQVRTGVQRAKLMQLNAQMNANIARNNLRQTIEQAYVDAVAAQRKYAAAKEQLRAAEKNYRNAEIRLNNGVINTVEFNVIANTFRAAQSNLLQAKYEYTFKQKVLDFYQGKDLSF
ncbi:TolC family protein [Pontibacter sp. 172403-2]|uniref:TolC family protein n=1 Tax=Pontibacter rufus TaxID=2791028 RepID=UPI0018AFE47E|nr:TolC family protein [Pontibacter sp. 172403-2]MBF9253560.1 TolC family protein [Pontibacter sp. 172403-2]